MPRRVAGVDTVIEARGRGALDELPGRSRDVVHVARADGAIDEDPGRLPRHDGVDDPIDAAPPPRAAEQAFDAQHVMPRRIGGKPVAEQLRAAVDALGLGLVLFGVRARRGAVEHEVGAVVDKQRPGHAAGAGQRAHRVGVDPDRVDGAILGAVHVVERRAVDDGVRALFGDARGNRRGVRQIDILTRQRHDVSVEAEVADDRRPELARGPGDDDPSRHCCELPDADCELLPTANCRLPTANCTRPTAATTSACCASVSSP